MNNYALLLSADELDDLDTPRFEKVKSRRPSERELEKAFAKKGNKHNRADRRNQKRDYE